MIEKAQREVDEKKKSRGNEDDEKEDAGVQYCWRGHAVVVIVHGSFVLASCVKIDAWSLYVVNGGYKAFRTWV